MAAGAPVLTSGLSSMPEVAGEAAFYCDPRDTASIRDGLLRGLTDSDLRRRLREAGPRRASGFSWERFARETLDVIERASGRSRVARRRRP
jgi:glycosyltransferase involved in cell wall biosynthesis